MKTKEIFRELIKISPDTDTLQKVCVSAYATLHKLDYSKSKILSSYLLNFEGKITNSVLSHFHSKEDFPLSLLVEVFESIVPYSEKKKQRNNIYSRKHKKIYSEICRTKRKCPYYL